MQPPNPSQSRHTITTLLILTVCLILSLLLVQKYDLLVALRGFSPVGWTYQYLLPHQFQHNFIGGVEQFDKSLFMHVYPLALTYLHIPPDVLYPYVAGLEILLMAGAAVAIIRTLFPNASSAVPFLMAMMIVASFARDISLSRFAQPFFVAQYYNVADAARLFAILLVLKGRYVPAGVLLALSLATHPIYGIVAGIFMAATLLVKNRSEALPLRQIALGLGVAGALAGGWFLLAYHPFSHAKITTVPNAMWYAFTQLNSSHWYPLARGLFTTAHTERFIQYLAFFLLFVYFIFRKPLQLTDKKILAGVGVLMSLVTAGMVFSWLKPSQTLIKLSLQRADDLAITFALAYVVHGLWEEICEGAWWRKTLALLVILSPMYLIPGFPVGFSLLLVIPAWRTVLRGQATRWTEWLAPIFSAGIIALLGAYAATGMLAPWDHQAYTGHFAMPASLKEFYKTYVLISSPLEPRFESLLFWSAVLMLLGAGLQTYLARRHQWWLPLAPAAAVVLIFWSSFGGAYRVNQRLLPASVYDEATAYKQTQLWAEQHTDKQALFMLDPNIYYGWRDFSHRSSFGNLREWLYTGWLYDSNYAVFQEGIRRFSEFGLDYRPYLTMPVPQGFDAMAGDVERKYYELTDQKRLSLAQRYGIDYFLLKKAKYLHNSTLPVVFENSMYLLLKVPAPARP